MPHTDQEFRDNVISSLSRLEENMRMLVGNGQPGRVSKIEDRVSRVEKIVWGGWGAVVLIGFLAKFAPFVRGLL